MIPDANFTLAAAKAHLRVTHADEDAVITAMLDAAVGMCERITRRAWTERRWSVNVGAPGDGCGCCAGATYHAELSPATAKLYATASGTDTELPATDYYVATRYGSSVLVVPHWPGDPSAPGDVGRIDWIAAPPNEYVPPDVIAAAMLYLGDLFENREAQIVGTITGANPAAEMLLRSYVVDMTL